MVGFDNGCRAGGIAPRRLSTTAPAIRKENAKTVMSTKFGFKPTAETTEETGTATGEPQAYVFLGRDKYRADEITGGAQGWRELFLTLSTMAANGTRGKVTQNTFGLEILYTGLLEILETAKKELGSDFQSTYDATLAQIKKDETAKAERKAARSAADALAEMARNLELTPEPATKTVTKLKK